MQSHVILSQRFLDAIPSDNLSFHLSWLCIPYCLGFTPDEEGGLRYVKEYCGSVNRGFFWTREEQKKSMRVSWCHVRKNCRFPVELKLSLQGWWVQGTATTGTSWRFSFSLWPGSPVRIHVFLLVVAADPAAYHTFIYTLLFYQLYKLYMQNSEKMKEMLSLFEMIWQCAVKMKCFAKFLHPNLLNNLNILNK